MTAGPEGAFLSILARSLTEESLLAEIAHQIKEEMPADAVDILLTDRHGGLVLMSSTHRPELIRSCRIGPGIGIAGMVSQTGEAIALEEGISSHPLFASYYGIDEESYESGIAEPLKSGRDVLGVMWIRRSAPWTDIKKATDKSANLAMLASEALRAFRSAYDAGARASKIGAVSEVTRIIGDSPYLEEVLQLLVNITAQQFQYRVCTVRLLDEENQELVLRATQSTDKAYQRKRAIKLGESIAGRAIEQDGPVIIPDVQVEEDYVGHDLAVEQGLRSMVCIPLKVKDLIVGVMSCYTSEVREFPDDEVRALETIAKQAAVSIEHAKLQVRHTLMQEMHHRVKNNLQQIASLLRLQQRTSSYKSLSEALNDTQSRILAIAAVHDLLSREDLDHVDMLSVSESLVHHTQQSILMPDKTIAFEVRGDRVRLNTSQATQVALILNELLQNAVEHGFENAGSGDIHITVEDRNNEVRIWVANNGDPLPEGFSIKEHHSLGLQIVENLARSLGGSFKISDIFGWTVAEVRFTRHGGE